MRLTHKIPLFALSIALVFVATSIISIQMGTSLTNLGDAFIFLFASLFGPLAGFISGSIGSALADIALGWGHTAIYTFIIKGIEGLIVGLLFNKLRKKEYKLSNNLYLFLFSLIGSLIMIGGYYLAEAFMYGSMEAAIISIYTNILQASLSIVTFLIVYNLLIKVKIISKISKEI